MEGEAGKEGLPAVEERSGDASHSKEFWGNEIGPRNKNLRVVYNNINGLRIGDFLATKAKYEKERKVAKSLTSQQDVTKLSGVISAMNRWDANIICCAETQTAWELGRVCEIVGREMRKMDRYSTMIGSSSGTVTSELYKPGGTVMFIDGYWSSRTSKQVDTHKLGRWSIATIRGRNNSILSIITAYRCCQGTGVKKVGSISALAQQEALLRKMGITKTPWEMFIVDLTKLLEELIAKRHEILLNVDANETWDSQGSRIKEMATRTGLYDIGKERHGGTVPATFERLNCARRVDSMLCSEGVLQCVPSMGIANRNYDPVLGDHSPEYVDIDAETLLQLNVHDIGAPTAGKLKSSIPKCDNTYIKKVKENFLAHNIYERVESLWDEIESRVTLTNIQMDKYEAIDRDVVCLCRNAENISRCINKVKYVWSPALDLVAKAVQYWTSRKKYFHHNDRIVELLDLGGATWRER